MPSRKAILLTAAGVSTFAIGWAIFRSRSAEATETAEPKQKEIPMRERRIALIGDSQTHGKLGPAFEQVFCDYASVKHYGKPGATHLEYLGTPGMLQQIRNMSPADAVYIQLGDNGVPGSAAQIRKFANYVKRLNPEARIFWGGPMRPVAPTNGSDVYIHEDPNSSRYLPTYRNNMRRQSNKLRDALEGTGVRYIDNYRIQESRPREAAFSDSRGGDGIHLTADAAYDLACIAREAVDRSF